MKIYNKFIDEYNERIKENEIWEKLKTKIKDIEYDKEQFEILKFNDIVGDEIKFIEEQFLDAKGYAEYKDGEFNIVVDVTNSSTARRFTLAHELGHILLHSDILRREHRMESNYIDNVLYHSNTEIEANRFAIEILVPENDVMKFKDDMIDEKKAKGEDLIVGEFIDMCFKRYGVSKQSIVLRLTNLEVIKNGRN